MAIDGGLVVGYLTAAILRGGKRVPGRTIDQLLDRLSDVVIQRVGNRLDRLKHNPLDETAQREAGLTIDGATSANPEFAAELAKIVAALDRAGGRKMINQVYADANVQAFDHGVAIGRDFNYFHTPDPSDWSQAPLWTKLCIVIGSIAAVSGIFIFGLSLFNMPNLGDPDFGTLPPTVPIGAGIFFVGFVFLGVGAMGRSMSRRR